MKKITILLLLILLITFNGCALQDSDLPLKELSEPINSYDSESRIQMDEQNNSNNLTEISESLQNTTKSEHTNSSENEVEETNSFLVKTKKYTYEGFDVIILDVTNDTDENCTLTINVTYFDQNGAKLKSETQSFEGFPIGYRNYFLFQPEIAFSEFEYTLQVSEYTEECLASNIELGWNGKIEERKMTILELMQATGDTKAYPAIYTGIYYHNSNDKPILITRKVIVLDENGNIFTISESNTKLILANKTEAPTVVLYYEKTDSDTLDWPNALKGDIRFIIAVENVSENQ